MIKLVQIYNLNWNDKDVVYINVYQISSIKQVNYSNGYYIIMNNNRVYKTDEYSFKKIMEVINND